MARTHRLRAKQALFIDHFLVNGGRATAAARSAGYRHAGIAAHKLLAADHILAPIVVSLVGAGDAGREILGKLCRGSRSDAIRNRVDLILRALSDTKPVARQQGRIVVVQGSEDRDFVIRMKRQLERGGADFGAKSEPDAPKAALSRAANNKSSISNSHVEAVSVAATQKNTR